MGQTTPTPTPWAETAQKAAADAFAGSRHLTPAVAWQIALDRYNAARGTETAYDEEVWTPANKLSETGGPAIPDEVEAEMERLQTVRMEAEDAMMDTPSPTLSTVIFKIETARRRWEDFCFPDSVLDLITADLRRIEEEG